MMSSAPRFRHLDRSPPRSLLHARRRCTRAAPTRASRASYDAKLDAIRAEVRTELGAHAHGRRRVAGRHHRPRRAPQDDAPDAGAARARMVAEIKQQLQSEMGLLPVHLLRDRRSSFVELYSYDNLGQDELRHRRLSRATATSSPSSTRVVALQDEDDRPERAQDHLGEGRLSAARRFRRSVVDTGDADVEVHSGDWAIIKTRDARPAGAARRHRFALRLRRSDLPPRQRLLEGHHPLDRLRRPAHRERPRHLPHRRPSGRVGRRRARPAAAISSASRSAGCRATTASRSSSRFARRCCASCRASNPPMRASSRQKRSSALGAPPSRA